MAKFRIDSIADLARQLTFAPCETRAAQLSAAEELLHLIDPAKAYPIEFVVFRITGYHPKNLAPDLLTGVALQHDLGLLVEKVSATLDVRCDALREPVLSIDDVTERFDVTSKTIQRWRRRGLPARRFIFADGKRRVGFLLGSVERFFSAHRDQVQHGTNLAEVDDAERAQILRRAAALAQGGRCSVSEICRRVARKLNRSPATILHTVRKHDQQRPSEALFPKAASELTADERDRALKLFKRGMSLGEVGRRLGRPRTMVYRALFDERAARLSRRKVRFIDDELYHGPDAEAAIGDLCRASEASAAPLDQDEARVPRDLPAYFQDLYRTPLLGPARERALFLTFNFHKWQFVQARRRLDPEFARGRDLAAMEAHLQRATAVKNAIVQANLRLVVSIARKHLRPGLSLMELISEGNLTLMRAVEAFDVHKGHRFSTYATLALMKGFARSVPLMLAARGSGGALDAVMANVADRRVDGQAQRWADRDDVGVLLGRLNDRERRVLSARYGVGGSGAAATVEQVGRQLGLSRQRVRQIARVALAKLRAGATAAHKTD